MSLTIESTKPGVVALVNQGQVSRPLERQPSSTAFVVGFASWGPIGVRQVVSSYAEFMRTFGVFHALGYLAEFAYIFFNFFSGRQIVAVRAGTVSAITETTIQNRAVAAEDALKVRPLYQSNNLGIKMTVIDEADNTTVTLKFECAKLNIREVYQGFTVTDAAIADINAKSKLVRLTKLAPAASGGNARPAIGETVITETPDGSTTFDTATMGTYLQQFADENLGTGQVAVPGHPSAAVNAALIAHAQTYNRLAVLDSQLGDTAVDAIADFDLARSSHAAAYYPWVEMNKLDGSTGRKFYPPSMFAVGACAQVDRSIGTHKAPANLLVPLALDVERNADGTSVINDNVREMLNAKQVNAIAPIQGEGIKIYGARVLYPTGETRVRFVHERRMLNLIYYTAKLGYAWAVFAVVDGRGRLLRDLAASGRNFLRNLWRDGALFGKTEEEAFIVIADESNNPPDELEQGRVRVQLGAKLSPTAEIVVINIDSVPLSQDLGVLQN